MRIEHTTVDDTLLMATIIFDPEDGVWYVARIYEMVEKRFKKNPELIPGGSVGETPTSIRDIRVFLAGSAGRKRSKPVGILLDLSLETHILLLKDIRTIEQVHRKFSAMLRRLRIAN